MAEELDSDAKKFKVLKNFLSLFAHELERLCANQFDLPRAKQLELLEVTSKYITALDMKGIVNPTPNVKREIEELKGSIETIVDLLRNPPEHASTYGLVAKLARASVTKIRAVENHLERTRNTKKSRKRGHTAKQKIFLAELACHPEWIASAFPRIGGENPHLMYSDRRIEAILRKKHRNAPSRTAINKARNDLLKI